MSIEKLLDLPCQKLNTMPNKKDFSNNTAKSMSKLFSHALIFFACTFSLQGNDANYLNCVIFKLPPKFLADIPFNQRVDFLCSLSLSAQDNRLDYKNGYVHFFSDSDEIGASSMFHLKLFPENPHDPFARIILINMEKPHLGHKPSNDDTFVLRAKSDDTWEDITEKVLPKGI